MTTQASSSECERKSIALIRETISGSWPWSLTKNVGGDKYLRENYSDLDTQPSSLDYYDDDQSDEVDLKKFESSLDQLNQYNLQYQKMVDLLSLTSRSLEFLMHNYHSVAHKTSSLHDTCEKLMADQTQLASAAQDLRDRLTYFDHLEQLTHKLSSPLVNVNTEAFLQILNTVDTCMQFMSEHPKYKEASVYLAKYQHCLSRALSMVKSYVCSLLTNAVQTINSKRSSTIGEEDAFTLYYGLFAAQAPTIRNIMEQIEFRWDRNLEYQTMVDDVYTFYFAQREALVAPSVRLTMQEMLKKNANNLCGLIRSGCSFLSRMCEDEQTLYYRFFSRPSPLFVDFAERLSSSLYDSTRPLIVHVPHLETLSELCSILRAEAGGNLSSSVSASNEASPAKYPSDAAYGFSRAVNNMLGDVSERLVYRAQLYARNDIAGYQPAPGDLAYPEKLEMMAAIANSLQQQPNQPTAENGQTAVSSEATSEAMPNDNNGPQMGAPLVSPADLHGLWYPPVRRAVMCLAKLYKSLDSTVFHGLCQDVLTMAVQALLAGSQQILKTKSPLDGYLFLIKHLLILREQTVPFRIDAGVSICETDVDFGKLKLAAANLIVDKRRLVSLNNNSLLEFILQMPNQMSQQIVDSRRALDVELRAACQQFIAYCSRQLSGGIEFEDFLEKAATILEERKKDGTVQPLKNQPFATADKVRDLGARAFRQFKDSAPNLVKKLNLYIASRDTENILFNPVRKASHIAFKKFADIVATEYSPEEQQIVACPSIEQVNLLLSLKH